MKGRKKSRSRARRGILLTAGLVLGGILMVVQFWRSQTGGGAGTERSLATNGQEGRLGSPKGADQGATRSVTPRERARRRMRDSGGSLVAEAEGLLAEVDPSLLDPERSRQLVKEFLTSRLGSRDEGKPAAMKDDRKMDRAIALLESALQLDGTLLNARVMLVTLYLRCSEAGRAFPHLLAVPEEIPGGRLLLAVLYEQQGNREAAREQARLAVIRHRSDPAPDQGGELLQPVLAEALGGDAAAALSILEKRRLLGKDPRIEQLEILIRLRECRMALEVSPPRYREALENLERVFEIAPRNPIAHERLADVSAIVSARDGVERLLLALVGAGVAHYEVYVALGNLAAGREEYALAAEYLGRAIELNPDAAVAKNNLAWCMMSTDPPHLERALDLVEQALATDSAMRPQFDETRGQILLKMERWMEAVASLERALAHLDPVTQAGIHRGLAIAYEHLGHDGLASFHRRASDPLDRTPLFPSSGSQSTD